MDKIKIDMESYVKAQRKGQKTTFFDKNKLSIYESDLLVHKSYKNYYRYFIVRRVIDDEKNVLGHTLDEIVLSEFDKINPNAPINIKKDPRLMIQKDCDDKELFGKLQFYSKKEQKKIKDRIMRNIEDRVYIPANYGC